MEPWVYWLVVVLIVGIAAIYVGGLRDRQLRTERERLLTSPPDRAVPGVQDSPHYVSDAVAGREKTPVATLTDTERATIRAEIAGVEPIEVGWAAHGFANDPSTGWAALTEPEILICDDPIVAIRGLLPVLDPARPLVAVAPEFSAEVVRTLEVNRLQHELSIVAITANPTERESIAAATGAQPLSWSDLQAGYLPADHLGRCARWVSDSTRSWIVGSKP